MRDVFHILYVLRLNILYVGTHIVSIYPTTIGEKLYVVYSAVV